MKKTFNIQHSTPNPERGAVRMPWTLNVKCWLLNVLFLFVLSVATTHGATNDVTDVPAPCCRPLVAVTNYTDTSLFLLDSTWTTDAGKSIKLGALRGRPQVVAMFFASCQFTCPLTVNDLKNIEAALPKNLRGQVGFTLISFDSERDTPTALRTFRASHELNDDHWTLLRGEPDDVRELAALLGVIYKKDANGDFAHSNLITVLNAEGEIVLQQPGLNLPPDEIVAKLKTITPP